MTYGAAMAYQGFATTKEELWTMGVIQGLFSGMIEAILYNIIGDFFLPKLRTKALLIFAIFMGFLFPMSFGVPMLIKLCKSWRTAWFILGGITIFLGFLMLTTVKEPKQPKVLAQGLDEDEIQQFRRQATRVAGNEMNAEIKVRGSKVILSRS